MSSTPPREPHPAGLRLARLRIDLAAAVGNWRMVGAVQPSAEIAAVVKADGYGLGATPIASALAAAGARTFFVATAQEGARLRASLGPGPLIYVLNGAAAADAAMQSGADLRPVLNTLDQIAVWRDAGLGGPFALHIDTGMNRLGLPASEIGAAKDALGVAAPALVLSHLACASTPDHAMNRRQRDAFLAAAAHFPAAAKSLAASAGALQRNGFGFDLVRAGIALYGSWDAETGDCPAMTPVAHVCAPILQIREIQPGETVGYGATFTAESPMRLATVAAGYADGIPRALSNRGFAAVDGVICAYVGRVSMDLIVINITDAPVAQPGARVELLGADAPLDEVARAAGAIPYELLTAFGAAVAKSWS